MWIWCHYQSPTSTRANRRGRSDSEPAGKFLPHQAVIRRDKSTTKLRIIYYAWAKSTGCALNNCLNKGPKFNSNSLYILLRFHTHSIVLIADIEKVFLNSSIFEQDRDSLEIIWVSNINSEAPKMLILRFAWVVFGLSSSPFLLNATLQHHFNQHSSSHPHLVRLFANSTYVDDNISGVQDELRWGRSNLHKFVTNSEPLLKRINLQEKIVYLLKSRSRQPCRSSI